MGNGETEIFCLRVLPKAVLIFLVWFANALSYSFFSVDFLYIFADDYFLDSDRGEVMLLNVLSSGFGFGTCLAGFICSPICFAFGEIFEPKSFDFFVMYLYSY